MSNFTKKITTVFLSFLFITCLFVSLRADSKQCVWKDIDKIIAVGDIHGDYDNFVQILKRAGLVDNKLKWVGGKIHFVQTGDIMDRGDYAKDVFDLIRRLEKEAIQAGGRVHMLIGNHEEMNITGTAFRQPTYVSPKQFVSFLPEEFREKKENEFRGQLQNLSEVETNSDPSFLDSYLETKWKGLMDDVGYRRLYVNSFNDTYGRWIIEHSAVIKINDTIFAHGGIGERYSTWPLERINRVLSNELNIYRLAIKRRIDPKIRREILYMQDSPLWNRDLALKDEKTFQKTVNKILDNLEAKNMVIAHTPPSGSAIVPKDVNDPFVNRFGDKIYIIDTGISDIYHGVLSFLTIENGEFDFSAWREEEYEEEIPFDRTEIVTEDESREEVEYYLSKAAIVNAKKEAVPGRTAAWKIDLDDGEIKRRALFKPINDPRPAHLPESYKYELAAYALDKLLDFKKIPPMIKREIEGSWGSLQIRVENCFSLDVQQVKNMQPPDPQGFENTLEEINVFENLVYDERQDLDDILIHEDSWNVYRVDFSEAFDPTPNLIPEQKITRCSKTLFQNLQELADEVIKAQLNAFLNEEEMSGLLSRKALIIKTLKKLIAEKGEEAVLF